MAKNSTQFGQRGAADEFVAEHLPLVRQAIDRVCRSVQVNVGEDDLQAIGIYALERAAERYQADERNVSPGVFAAHYVRAALLDSVKATSRTAAQLGCLQSNLGTYAPIPPNTPRRVGPVPVPLQQKKSAV